MTTALYLACTYAAPASAQQPEDADTAASKRTTDELVVTARRTEENINEVPIAVTAFSADDLSKLRVDSLVDVASYTAGFSFENFAGNQTPAPIIRGLTQNTLTDRNQNVGTFLNGVHIQQQGNIDLNLLDVERIEILKGPQNTRYGRSTFAGAINYVPVTPDVSEWDGDVSVLAGNYERLQTKGSINVPVVKDMLAVRVFGAIDESDGALDNNFSGGDNGVGVTDSLFGQSFAGSDGNLGGWDNKAYQLQLQFQPTDAIALNLSYYNSETDAEQGAIQFVRPNSVDVYNLDRQTNCNPSLATGNNRFYCGELDINPNSITVDPRSVGLQAETQLTSVKFDWDITEQLSFMYLGAVNDLESNGYSHSTNPANPEFEGCGFFSGDPACGPGEDGSLLFITGPSKQDAKYHEFRFGGSQDAFDWTLGYFYAEVEDQISLNSVEGRRSLIQDPTGQTIVYGAAVPATNFDDRTNAIYGTASFDFASIYTLDLEGRYSKERREQSGTNLAPANFYLFTPRVNLRAQVTDQTMFYGSVAKGAKAGGFNTVTADPGFETFDPETNLTYELGSKWLSQDRNMHVYANVYYIDWKDLQLPTADLVPTNPGGAADPNYITNASGAKVWGVELESAALLYEHWAVNFVFSYTKTEFDSDALDFGIGAQCAGSSDPVCNSVVITRPGLPDALAAPIGGNELPRQPQIQAAFGLGYLNSFRDWNYEARGDLTYQDKQYLTTLNLGYIPDRTLLNLNLSLESPDGHWRTSLWGKNVTDETYVSNSFVIAFANNYTATVAPGATYGVTLSYNFAGR